MSTRKKINIINFDSIVNEVQPQWNCEQFKSPLSMIINAPRQSGKTNLLLNLLIGEDGEPLLYYDKIYLMSISKSQKKYKFLDDYFKELAEQTSTAMNKKNKNKDSDEDVNVIRGGSLVNMKTTEESTKIESIFKVTNDWTELPQMEEPKEKKAGDESKEKEREHYLVIFDDVLKLYEKDNKFRNYVDTLYIAGRHSISPISPIFIGQSYCDLDSALRKNTTHTILMGYPTRALLNVLAGAIPIADYKVYRDIFKEHIEFPYDFVLLNTFEVDLDKKIWVDNLNKPVPIKHLLKATL